MKTKIILFLLIVSGIFNLQNNLFAQLKTCLLFEGLYSTINGGFDGETILIGEDKGFLVPKLKGNWGYGFSLGRSNEIGYDMVFYGGLKYARFGYDATFLEENLGKAKNNLFGMEYKFLFPKFSSIRLLETRLFISIGFEVGILKVENGYVDLSYNRLGDVSFSWYGLPVGSGFAIILGEAISINLGVDYRFAKIFGVKKSGASGASLDLKDKLYNGGLNCSIGLLISFESS
ncbi:MAG: hypothetical protein EHM20_06215 [Alphaproteobacteria bacterium]|nr:MAG: hypothetical protein EHM20_06215 [Alphaproteobacteria bacterium]